ncbi:MAG TPA: ABC transporter ATP-binding protein [Clostridia bacterium]|nr:ABC transporter ATP-binding protein [Clostridia bacterium]
MTGEIIIRTENLTKCYGTLKAVDGLNLEIRQGEVFGLLGPNGAGKTTTILMLLGLTEPTEGKAWIRGHDCTREPLAVKRFVSYLPDNVGFYEDMTGRENLRFTGQLNGLGGEELEKRIDDLAQRVGLAEAIDRKVGTYSRGMRQRLGIADVLVKDPAVVILDEPTLGIDPQGIEELLQLIKALSVQDGRTVLVSSHLLHQMQKICDRVGIFVRGKLLAAGPIDTLWEQVSGQGRWLELKVEPDGKEVEETLRGLAGVETVKREGTMYLLQLSRDLRRELVSRLVEGGYTILHLRMRQGDLDDIYRLYFQQEGVA